MCYTRTHGVPLQSSRKEEDMREFDKQTLTEVVKCGVSPGRVPQFQTA